MNEKNEKDAPKDGVRDLDFREDFNEKGELVNPEMAAHYDAEREKLLGTLIGSTDPSVQGYLNAPPVIEKAAPDEKVEIAAGDSADVLAAKYSKKQITDFANEMGVEYKPKDSKLSIAIEVLKKHQADAETNKDTSLNTLPMSPETHRDLLSDETLKSPTVGDLNSKVEN